MCKYSDELVGKAVKWHYYEESGYIDINASGGGTNDNELDELVEMFLQRNNGNGIDIKIVNDARKVKREEYKCVDCEYDESFIDICTTCTCEKGKEPSDWWEKGKKLNWKVSEFKPNIINKCSVKTIHITVEGHAEQVIKETAEGVNEILKEE